MQHSAGMTGRKHTEASKAKMSAAQIGRKHSEASKIEIDVAGQDRVLVGSGQGGSVVREFGGDMPDMGSPGPFRGGENHISDSELMVNRSSRSRRRWYRPCLGNEGVGTGYGNQPDDTEKNHPHVLTPLE